MSTGLDISAVLLDHVAERHVRLLDSSSSRVSGRATGRPSGVSKCNWRCAALHALRRFAGTHLIGYAVPAAETAGYKTADKE